MGAKSFIRDDNIELRTVEEDDLGLLQSLLNMRKPKIPYNFHRTEEYFHDRISNDKNLNLIIRYGGEDRGLIETTNKDTENGKIDMDAVFLEGYGEEWKRDAVRLFVNYLFKQLRLHRVGAEAMETEKEKQNLWKDSGFRDEGNNRKEKYRKGSYIDVKKFGILEEKW